MASILIIGESGSGKSTSLRNINGKEAILINPLNKPLPFKGGKKKFGDNIIFTDNSRIIVNKILEAEKNKAIKVVIIDDFQAIMTNSYLSTIENKGYEKFTRIGKSVWDILNAANNCRSDLKVVLLAHSETDANGKIVCKTVGKLVSEKISIEGMCTLVLHSKAVSGKYTFLTQNDGVSIAKSPLGMFNNLEIDNDLAEVINIFDVYYDEEDIAPIKVNDLIDSAIIDRINECKDVGDLTNLFKEISISVDNELEYNHMVDLCAMRKKEILKAHDDDVLM